MDRPRKASRMLALATDLYAYQDKGLMAFTQVQQRQFLRRDQLQHSETRFPTQLYRPAPVSRHANSTTGLQSISVHQGKPGLTTR